MRDTTDVGEFLTFRPADWAGFRERLKGRLPGADGAIRLAHRGDRIVVGHPDGDGELSIAHPDWAAFVEGVRAGEFDA